MLISEAFWIKGIKVSKLKEMLDKLDPDTYVSPNPIQNINLYQGDQFIGFIDILSETLDLIEPSNELIE